MIYWWHIDWRLAMDIPITDETEPQQRVEINRSIDEVCLHHILGTPRIKPLPTYIMPNSNLCFGCLSNNFNRNCPRYIPVTPLTVFEILENY